ncbi:hypothetical protein [Nonomuraea indica]|uniref:hypothetical protein n=1 Tax=Nonomuraea indica TaxID=1581193 RepID=UPI000C7C67C6|nr:hypothetical protein [Nonomuraea indica]
MDARDLKLMALLAQMYPAWRISCRTDRHGQRCWWAIQWRPPNSELKAAGVHQSIARPSVDELATALSRQARILHTRRFRHP